MYILNDDMKRESILWVFLAVFFCVNLLTTPVRLYFHSDIFSKNDIIKITIVLFVFSSISLYGFLETYKYSLEITNDVIKARSLFKKYEVKFTEISSYSYKRHMCSRFYQFYLRINNKKLMISTSHKSELIKILEEKNIPLVYNRPRKK